MPPTQRGLAPRQLICVRGDLLEGQAVLVDDLGAVMLEPGHAEAEFGDGFADRQRAGGGPDVAGGVREDGRLAIAIDIGFVDPRVQVQGHVGAGGSGKTFNWSYVKGAKDLGIPIILSGGLHYNNVVQAIEEVRPFAVDTASGVEDAPGKKNERSMRLFIEKASL